MTDGVLGEVGSGYPGGRNADAELRRYDPTLVFLKNIRTNRWLVCQDLRLVPIQDQHESPWQVCVDKRLVGAYTPECGTAEFGKPTPYNVLLTLEINGVPVILPVSTVCLMVTLACPRGGDKDFKRRRRAHNERVDASEEKERQAGVDEWGKTFANRAKGKVSIVVPGA